MNINVKMKTSIILLMTTIISFFAPVGITIGILFGFILLDTLVKIVSLKVLAKRENKSFFDLFLSRTLRTKFILKSMGYLVMAIPVTVLDIYILTPTLKTVTDVFFTNLIIPTDAFFGNILVIIFCAMELYSVNENWNVISKVDLFKKVSQTAIIIREKIGKIIDFIQELKRVK